MLLAEVHNDGGEDERDVPDGSVEEANEDAARGSVIVFKTRRTLANVSSMGG